MFRRAVPPSLAAALLAALLLAPAAVANHSITELMSTGPNDSAPYYVGNDVGISANGSRVFFESQAPLVSADTDTYYDVYERVGGMTNLVSTGPSGGTGSFDAYYEGTSNNGSHVFFQTDEQLVPADTDSYTDVYERFGGVTTLISAGSGPSGTTAPQSFFDGTSSDGTRVFFETAQALVPLDTDEANDVYERSGGTTTLISTGPTDAGTRDSRFERVTPDGARVFFSTPNPLVAGDTDSASDVYERSSGTTTLVSTGSLGGNGASDARFGDASEDGAHVFFTTEEQLEPSDTDSGKRDIYERSGGITTLVSTGPSDTGQWPACFLCPVRASADGSHVFFFTAELLVPGDTGYVDLYERSGGTTNLVSTGPSGGNGPYDVDRGVLGISKDGTHAFFATDESLVPLDADGGWPDIYERHAGTTKLVSTGPTDPGSGLMTFNAASDDGTRAVFGTGSSLVPSDTDSTGDVYERHDGTTTLLSTGPTDPGNAFGAYTAATPALDRVLFESGAALVSNPSHGGLYESRIAYETPQSSSPIQVSFVPTFLQCGTGSNPANGQHSPPLSQRACLPPKPGSNVARFGAQAVGTGQLAVVPGDPDTVADEADVSIQANLTDITATAGGDYNPNPSGADLTLTARLRLTDLSNCSGANCAGPYGRNAAATTDFDFPVAVDCSSTPDPGVGATCAVTTSAAAVMAGAVKEGQSTIAQAFRLRLNDSGANGVRGDADDRIFSTQGIYVP